MRADTSRVALPLAVSGHQEKRKTNATFQHNIDHASKARRAGGFHALPNERFMIFHLVSSDLVTRR
jgi:hypothetical protein